MPKACGPSCSTVVTPGSDARARHVRLGVTLDLPAQPLPPGQYRFLADVVLVLHFAIVSFIVGGLVLVVVGNLMRWRWVNARWFRVAHLAAIGVVVAQAWLGRICPLTTLESSLRSRAGSAPYAGSFIEHWVQRVLYYEAPAWIFALAYTCFGMLVAAAWWRFPPRSRRR